MFNLTAVRRAILSLGLFPVVLAWGCGSGSTPLAVTGSISGRVTNPGPVDRVHLALYTVETPLQSDGSFFIPNVPQGRVTLDLEDSKRLPYGYATLVVNPNVTTALPPIPGPVLGPNSSLPEGTPFDKPLPPGTIQGQVLRVSDGSPITSPVTLQLFNSNLQGGPTGSVGQNPVFAQPNLVAANQLNINSSPPASQAALQAQTQPFVTLQHQVAATVQSDASGNFVFPPLPSGSYFLVGAPSGDFTPEFILTVQPDVTTSVQVLL